MKAGDHVAWKWGNGIAEGTIEAIKAEPTRIVSKGKLISRNGTQDDPVLIIKHKSGNDVLKLQHEVQKTDKN